MTESKHAALIERLLSPALGREAVECITQLENEIRLHKTMRNAQRETIESQRKQIAELLAEREGK
jgi:phage shock protein A